ncbi:MAG: hypothetical protein E6501_29500, partial [Bradyrhizobium sp.]|nr:hypothetical protein [Bradyrhizobium sp.]
MGQEQPGHQAALELCDREGGVVLPELLQLVGSLENVLANEGHDSRIRTVLLENQVSIAAIA